MISETKRKATWQELVDRVDELQEKLDNSISKDKIREKKAEIEKMANGNKVIENTIRYRVEMALLNDLLKEE